MAQNNVNISITAQNFVSGTIQNIKNSIGGLSQTASVFAGSFMANMATAGIDLAIGKVRDLGSAIVDASRLQTTMLATSSDVGSNLGIGFEKAKNVVAQTNEEIAKMAAALPGTTAGYNAVFNSLAGTLARQFRGDTEQFSQVAMDITKRVGVLASIRNVDPGQSGAVIERLINGSAGFAELAQNDILQKNAVFKQAITDQLVALGVDQKQWKQLSTEVRLGIVRKALTVATPDTLIDAFNGTVDSMIESIKSDLFDPMVGIFGFLRKVPSAEGRSVIDAVQGFLQAWLGFSESMAKLAARLGFNFDPLEPLIRIFDFLADIGNVAHLMIIDDPQKVFKNLRDQVVQWISNVANNINNALTSMPSIDPVAIGYALAQATNFINDRINQLISEVDWSALGFALGDFLGKAVVALGAFLVSRDYKDIAQSFGNVLLAVIKVLGGLILGLVNGLLSAVRSNLYDATIRPLQNVAVVISNTWQAIIKFFKGTYDKVTSWLTEIVQQLKPQNVLSSIGSAVIPQPVQQAAQGAVGLAQSATDAARGAVQGVQGQFQGLLNRIQGKPDPKPQTNSPKPNVTPKAQPVSFTIPSVGVPRQLTNPSFRTAMARLEPRNPLEALRSPEGTNTPKQALTMPTAIARSHINTFSPTINIDVANGGADPDTIAEAVMGRITTGYRSFIRQQIA